MLTGSVRSPIAREGPLTFEVAWHVQGNILFARFYEGDGSFIDKGRNVPSDPMQRVQAASSGLVDVPIIMQTMRDAIKRAVVRAR